MFPFMFFVCSVAVSALGVHSSKQLYLRPYIVVYRINLALDVCFSSTREVSASVVLKQEGSAVAGNYRVMRHTRTESLHLILGQCSE